MVGRVCSSLFSRALILAELLRRLKSGERTALDERRVAGGVEGTDREGEGVMGREDEVG